MEPTIYKPSIYKGAGIYKTGAGGGGGGDVITLSLDIANFDTTTCTDGVFYFNNESSNSTMTKSGDTLVFRSIYYINIVGTDPSKLKSISFTISNKSFGNLCYAGYRVRFTAGTGAYFTNYGILEDFSDHVIYHDTHGMNLDYTGYDANVLIKRYDNFSSTKPITIKNVIDGTTNKVYANGNLIFECTYDIPQYELPLLLSNGRVWRYDNFGMLGTDTGTDLYITDITAEIYT